MRLCSLTFQPQNPMSFLGHRKVIPYPKFEHFEIIRFWVMLRTNRQTNKQTEVNILPTPTDSLGVDSNPPICSVCFSSTALCWYARKRLSIPGAYNYVVSDW